MEKIFNIRTLAKGLRNRNNYMVTQNAIFRSSDISHASVRDLEYLKNKKIKTVYDLRSRMEMEKDALVTGHSFNIKHVEILKEAHQNDFRALIAKSKSQNEEFMHDLYKAIFVQSKGFCVLIKEIISREDEIFLFHCTAGKDRTGILGAILMMILDFDIESIKKEYLQLDPDMTNFLAHKVSMMLGVGKEEIPTNLKPLFVVKSSYIDAFISSINSEHGNLDNYIRIGLGVSDEEKAMLKARYLRACQP